MAVDFRCENCGKMLSVEAEPGSICRCPHCRKKVTVPAGLASLPRPHVPPNAAPRPQAQAPPAEDEEEEEPVESEAVMGAMAMIMPWVISVFLHLGLFLIMLFFVMVVVNDKIPESVIIPDAVLNERNPGGVMNPRTKQLSRSHNERRTVVKRYSKREERVDKGKTEKTVELLAPSADGARGGAAELGLTNSDSRGGPRSRFFGSGGNAYHIIYVVDRSGSMAPTFDEVRIEMLKSISRLKPVQDFSIILFSNNKYIEGPSKRLVSASIENKLSATDFLKKINASGQTTVLPALKRAFTIFKYADLRRPGKLIYLLSDGDFAGITGGSVYQTDDGRTLNGNPAVVRWLKDNNKAKKIYINTFLYHSKDGSAVKVMKQVALDNGGRFKQISADE